MSGTSKHGRDPVDDAARQTASARAADKKAMTLTRVCVLAASLVVAIGAALSGAQRSDQKSRSFDLQISDNSQRMMKEGKQIFRFDTFGDETYWSGKLRLHDAIQGSKFGGVGPGVSPKTALAVGLKVDMDALPQPLVEQIKQGKVNLDDPATTLALIKLNSVLGVKGTFNPNGSLKAIGLTCAVCHSTVDDAFSPGIGHRLDAWSNQDLNVGAIVSLAPDLTWYTGLLGVDEATVKKVLASWGPGKFDAELNIDGKALRPDGSPAAVLIPPAYGQAGVNLHTWGGGWGGTTYWNAYVANLELGGQGTFFDARLNDPRKYPVAAKSGFWNKRSNPDLVTSKLGALQFYQLAVPPPTPPPGSFDHAAAARGEMIFKGKAACAQCHVPPLFTEPGWNTHKASEIGIDDFHANRAPDSSYRTTPLRGLFSHTKRGFYHDGRFATLMDVVNHYSDFKKLTLTEQEKKDLVEYLKSL